MSTCSSSAAPSRSDARFFCQHKANSDRILITLSQQLVPQSNIRRNCFCISSRTHLKCRIQGSLLLALAVPLHHSGEWDSGFFDVCAAGVFTMCQAHFCPCITYAQNERSLQMRENPDLQPSRWGYAHHIPWYCCLLSCGTHCFMHQRYRSRIRMLYQIKNASLGDTGDFLLSW